MKLVLVGDFYLREIQITRETNAKMWLWSISYTGDIFVHK